MQCKRAASYLFETSELTPLTVLLSVAVPTL